MLHVKYAPNEDVFNLVFTHCLIIRDIAEDLMRQNHKLEVDKEIVKAGALLHDIGAYALFKDGQFENGKYITHGIEGQAILEREGLDARLARIAAHHTGVGISKEDITSYHFPLPEEDFFADTVEERLVMYADKFHSKHPKFNTFSTYEKYVSKFGPDKVKTFRALRDEFGIPDLDVLVEKYGHPIT